MLSRRRLIQGAAILPLAPSFATTGSERAAAAPVGAPSRVRPGDPGWPSYSEWEGLRQRVEGQLIDVQSPLDACRADPDGDACRALFKELKNPYFIGDSPALTQTCGWLDAWTVQPSVYAVAARKTAHVVAAVNFAREKNLRLVVKGGGHSYLGTSNAADSLLIWTRAMNEITVHDAFVAQGCANQAPQPAVTVGAGAVWMHAYEAVTTGAGRYVQGGGCGTVGVAGLVQGGGFGSYSKQFGGAGASLLEAEIVTADGVARIANACSEPDLFWALKGGGAGSFGVVTRLTLRTWDLPDTFGLVATTIRAGSDEAYRRSSAGSLLFMRRHCATRIGASWRSCRPTTSSRSA
jgi:FAD/FMN-containing dehydrogenase